MSVQTRDPAATYWPTVFVQDELDERGWTHADLARASGLPVEVIDDLMACKRDFSAEVADGIGLAFGTGPKLWLNLQASAYFALERALNLEWEATDGR